MEKMKKYFGQLEMTWPKVIILALAAGVYTAIVNLLPFFEDTSFQDIAVYLEWWFLFAVFIIVNCKTWKEASFKCFVFFLISQPLIYLIQVPFRSLGWGLFAYYKYWFIITLLTLPGAAIAFQLKRKNWLSVLVLSVALAYLAWACAEYFSSAMDRFPRHLLSAVFCLALSLFFIFVLLDEKKHRIAALAFTAAVLIAAFCYRFSGFGSAPMNFFTDEGNWSCTLDDSSVAEVTVTDGNHLIIKGKHSGSTVMHLTNDDGSEQTYIIEVDGSKLNVTDMTE